jgi:hypothetical protein
MAFERPVEECGGAELADCEGQAHDPRREGLFVLP